METTMPPSEDAATPELVKALRQENEALKEQLKATAAERDAYLKAVHHYAKAKITAQDLIAWSSEVEDSGESILDVIEEIKKTS
jgi:hypothetical protein